VSVAASCFNAQAVAAPPLLQALLEAPGPSGSEEAAAAVWRDAASAFAEVTSDTLGNSFARVRAGDGAPTFAVLGHIDEIGVLVSNIEDNGLLSFVTIGGISPEPLLGSRIELLTRKGRVPGTIGRRRLASELLRDRPKLELADLHLDIGAASREEAESLVHIGDAGTWAEPPIELPGNRLLSKALDNRLGAYVALESARRVAEAGSAQVDVVAVAAVQEELGYHGARAAAFALEPQVAIAIDVTWATDVPGGDPKRSGKVALGDGAAVTVGPVVNTVVSDLLRETAEAEGITHCIEIYADRTLTDADAIHVSRGGVPTGVVSIPLRYMHSPVELGSLNDLEAVISLVTAFARRLTRETSFLR
jgi:putative aminopeptidase FrvX